MAELEAGLLAGFGLPAPGQPVPGQPERKGRTGYPGQAQAESIPVVHPPLPETAPEVSSGRPVPPVPKAPPAAPGQPGQAAFTEAASPESYSAGSARGSANRAGSYPSQPSQAQARQAASPGTGATGPALTGAAAPEAPSRPSGPSQGSAGSGHPQAESFRAASAQPGYAPGRPHPARAAETSSRSAETPKTTNRASAQAPYDQAAPVQEASNSSRPAAAARSSRPRANQPRTNPAENPSRPPTPTRGRPPADRLEPSPPEAGPLEAEEALATEYSTTPADLEAARHGARISARRRARSMAVLLLTTVVTWVFLAVGSLPVFIAIASTLLLTAHAVASRTAAVRSRETLTMLAAHLYAADMAREHAENRRRQAARVRARAEAEAAAQPPPERVTRRAGAVSADTWDPIPVPPPTYQLKPAVHRPAPPPLESPVQNPAAQKPQAPPGSDSNRGDQPVSRGSMPRRAADIERILELDQDADRPRAVNE